MTWLPFLMTMVATYLLSNSYKPPPAESHEHLMIAVAWCPWDPCFRLVRAFLFDHHDVIDRIKLVRCSYNMPHVPQQLHSCCHCHDSIWCTLIA